MVDNSRIEQAYKVLQSIIDAECGSTLYRFMKCTTVDKTKPIYTDSVEILLQFIEINYAKCALLERGAGGRGVPILRSPLCRRF